jgi:hypothetical protein
MKASAFITVVAEFVLTIGLDAVVALADGIHETCFLVTVLRNR